MLGVFFVLGVGPYLYMEDLLLLDRCRHLQPAYLSPALADVVTPLQWREWDRCLASHPDERFREYVVGGIRDGFLVGFDYAGSCSPARGNMVSAKQHATIVSAYLAEECASRRVIGPFDPRVLPQVTTSYFGVIPKSTPGKWRLILDLSSPEGRSVNDGISSEFCLLSYVGVEDAAREVVRLGRGSILAKVDVKSAYRNIPIHPQDRWLLGMPWEGGLFVDTALPFGLRSAPKIFTAVVDAVQWILQQEGVRFVIHFLADFLLVGAPESG